MAVIDLSNVGNHVSYCPAAARIADVKMATKVGILIEKTPVRDNPMSQVSLPKSTKSSLVGNEPVKTSNKATGS